MPFDTYSNLKTAIATFLDVGSSDLSSVVDDLIYLGQRRIEAELRVKEMEVSFSTTISMSTSGGTVPIPSDFLDFDYCTYIDVSGQEFDLDIKDAKWMRLNYPAPFYTGRPMYIGTELTNFIFRPFPDVPTYVLHGVYYRRQTQISTSVSDNTLYTKYPELFFFSALTQAEQVLGRDDRTAYWEQRYIQIRDEIASLNTKGNDRMMPTRF